jgi:hypothetical protein
MASAFSITIPGSFCARYNKKIFDKENKVIFKIGETNSRVYTETVTLECGEAIVGVAAKLLQSTQSQYTDF